MGIFDFFTGKSKAAPAPAGATDTSAAPSEALLKELEKSMVLTSRAWTLRSRATR